MKKEKISKIIFLILLMLLIIMILVTIIIQKPKDLTLQMYNNIKQKNNYTFSMEEQNSEIKYNLTIIKNDPNICIDTLSNDEHTSTLVKDGSAYYIQHSQKEYYLYDASEIDADILEGDIDLIKDQKYQKGYETINGKKYYYEEYEGISTYMLLTSYNEDSTIKTKYYYDDQNNISYIKTTVDDSQELLKIQFSDEVDETKFEIPQDYAEL